MRTSRTGRLSYECGFTLLELLVAFAIIGLLAISVPGFLLRENRNLDLEQFTRQITEGLRSTQTAAIRDNRDKLFIIDVKSRQFLVANADAPVQLPNDIRLGFATIRQKGVDQSEGRIRFFSDGSSTGGQITLTRDGASNMIKVDWLTGIVAVSSDAG